MSLPTWRTTLTYEIDSGRMELIHVYRVEYARQAFEHAWEWAGDQIQGSPDVTLSRVYVERVTEDDE